MKITTDTFTELEVYCPRLIRGDVISLSFVGLGSLFVAGALRSEPSWEIQLLFAFGAVFAGIGIWLVLTHSSARATLDATTQSLTLEWRQLKGRRVKTIPFSDIDRVDRHMVSSGEDSTQTIVFHLSDGSKVELEKGNSESPNGPAVANRMDEWIRARRTGAT